MQNSKIKIFDGFWTRDDVTNNPRSLFVFGDNNIGRGNGGQAIIRGLPNTIGIPTKKYPSNQPQSFYTDLEFNDNKKRISNAINEIIRISKNYDYVILPRDGFGTGLAQLAKTAPKTNTYLIEQVENLKKVI